MPYVQAYLDEATFKKVKKDAIDLDLSIGKYVKLAVIAKLERSKATRSSEVDSLERKTTFYN